MVDVRVVVAVRDFGPFEQASLELKPLTVIVGRNSVGKSMLAYLVWALAISMADFSRLGELAGKRELALAEKVYPQRHRVAEKAWHRR